MIMQLDYRKEKFTKVRVCGIVCDFSDMRIDRSIVPEGRYQYEVADDDEGQGNPVRVNRVLWSISSGRWSVMYSYTLGMRGYCG